MRKTKSILILLLGLASLICVACVAPANAAQPDPLSAYVAAEKLLWAKGCRRVAPEAAAPIETQVYTSTAMITIKTRVTCTTWAVAAPVLQPPVVPAPPLPSGTVQLSWTQPTARASGAALAAGSIAGYKIFSGTSATSLTEKTTVPPGTTATIAGFAPGTHYFALTTIDTSGLESAPSAVIPVVVK